MRRRLQIFADLVAASFIAWLLVMAVMAIKEYSWTQW
jgi:hypothetical protein